MCLRPRRNVNTRPCSPSAELAVRVWAPHGKGTTRWPTRSTPSVSSQLRGDAAGRIAAGAPAYLATLDAVCELPEVVAGDVPINEALAVLSDITARCQNRYEDAS